MKVALFVALCALLAVALAEQHSANVNAASEEAHSIQTEAERLIGLIQVHVAQRPNLEFQPDNSDLDQIQNMRQKVQAVRAKVLSFGSRFQGVGDRLISFRDRLQKTLQALDDAHAQQLSRTSAWDAAQRTAALRPAQRDVVVPINVVEQKPQRTQVIVIRQKPTTRAPFHFAMPRHADALSYHDLAESTADVETASYAAEVRLKAAAHERDVTRAAMQAEAELRQIQSEAALQQTAALTQFQQQALIAQARLEKTSAQAIERVEEALAVKKKNEKMAGVIRAQIIAMKPPTVIIKKTQLNGVDVDAVKVQQEITGKLRAALKQAQTASKVEQAKAINDAVMIQSLALRKQAAATKKLEAMLKTANKVKAAELAKSRKEQAAVTAALRKELAASVRATKPVPVCVRELSMVKNLDKTKNVPPAITKLMSDTKKSMFPSNSPAKIVSKKAGKGANKGAKKSNKKNGMKGGKKGSKKGGKKVKFLEVESELEHEIEAENEEEDENDEEED